MTISTKCSCWWTYDYAMGPYVARYDPECPEHFHEWQLP